MRESIGQSAKVKREQAYRPCSPDPNAGHTPANTGLDSASPQPGFHQPAAAIKLMIEEARRQIDQLSAAVLAEKVSQEERFQATLESLAKMKGAIEKEGAEILTKLGDEDKTAESAYAKKAEEDKAPIRFKDAVGRKFSFPFHLCMSWAVSNIWQSKMKE